MKRDYRQTTSVSTILDQPGWPSLPYICLNSRLRIFEKAASGRVATNTGDLVQPLRQTRHADLDLSFTALAARTDVYKYSFFPRTIRDWNSLDTLSLFKFIPQPPVDISCCQRHGPSGNGLRPLLGIYRSTKVPK